MSGSDAKKTTFNQFVNISLEKLNRSAPRKIRKPPNQKEDFNHEYFYLKTRDYVTMLRSTLGFSRFHERRPQDHSTWFENDLPNYKYLYEGNYYLVPLVHLGMGLPISEDGPYALKPFLVWYTEKVQPQTERIAKPTTYSVKPEVVATPATIDYTKKT